MRGEYDMQTPTDLSACIAQAGDFVLPQRFFTGRLDGPQCNGKPLEPIGEVDLGETFIVESTVWEERETLGPVFIKGVKPGDVVSIHIEDIHISKWYEIGPDYGMFPEVTDPDRVVRDEIAFYTPLDDGELVFLGDIRVPFHPMIGCLSLAANAPSPNPWAHGGNMDINEIRKGSTVYIRAQREGGLLALGDFHAYQGDGEIGGGAVEANGEAKVSVDLTDKFPASFPMIEVEDRVMTVGMGLTYWEAVQSAVKDMTYLLMKARNLSFEEAYTVAIMGGSLRNGAIWMMVALEDDEDRYSPRTVFLELPFPQSS